MLKNTLRQHLVRVYQDQDLEKWFDPLMISLDTTAHGKELRVKFPHYLFARWFMETKLQDFELHIRPLVEEARISYTTMENGFTASSMPAKASSSRNTYEKKAVSGERPLNRHTFETFLFNRKNDFPVAVAKKASLSCGAAKNTNGDDGYSPFVIYGASGSGKTHLLGAIANDFAGRNPQLPFFYGSVESFIQALDIWGRMGPGHPLTENSAVFIDDVQRIADNINAQVGLYILMDIFSGQNKLLSISLDNHPGSFRNFSAKLMSRLNSGLTVELKKPDIDIRRQYAKLLATQSNISLSNEEILTIAQRFFDLRHIEGVLLKIAAFRTHGNAGKEDRDDFTQILHSGFEQKVVTPQSIIAGVAKFYGVPSENITGQDRTRKTVRARQMAMYLCRDMLGLSLAAIGGFFGGKDHSSVLYAIKKINEMIDTNKSMNTTIPQLKRTCFINQT